MTGRFVVPLIKNISPTVWFPIGSIVINGVMLGVTFAPSALANGTIIITAKKAARKKCRDTRNVISIIIFAI